MRQSAALRNRNKPHRFVPTIVFFATLLATLVAWFIAYGLAVRGDRDRFKGSQIIFEKIITERLTHQTRLGDSAAAFMGSSPNASEADFDGFLRRQSWPESAPEIGVISYLKHVPPGGSAAFVAYARSHGVSNPIVDMTRDRFDQALALYRLPVEAGMRPPGFDASSIESRGAAIRACRDAGSAVSTDPIHLVQDKDPKQTSVVVYIPVYSTPTKPKTEGARQQAITGYVGVSIRMAVATKDFVSQYAVPYITVRSKSTQDPADVLFSNLPPDYHYRSHISKPLNIFNRTWECDYYSSPSFEADSGENLSAFILGGGLIFALIFFFLSNNQLNAQKELAGYAEEIERLASAESLLAQAGTLFASTDDYKLVLEQIGMSAVPLLADLCSVDVLENGEIIEVAVFGLADSEIEEAKQLSRTAPISLTDDYGIGKALRTGKSELLAGLGKEFASDFKVPAPVVDYVVRRGFTSAMFVPVQVRGTVLATLTFITGPEKRPFTSSDLRQMEEVAERIGLAIDNSRLFLAAQQELEEKIKAEEALRALNEELEQLVTGRTRELTVAVDELEAFCYSVSHDLRAPLRSVDGFSKALLEDYQTQLDADGVDYLTRIRRAAHRMDELITALLTLSRLTRAEISPIDVDVTEIAEEIAHDNIDSKRGEVLIQKGMVAHVDPHMMRILFENLIANAVKFSGKVDAPKIEIGKQGDVFFVKDNGAGFDPRYSNKLFQPFERLHTPQEFPGSGIGLATVSRVVKRHGGKIWAESEIGQGATFYFTFEPTSD